MTELDDLLRLGAVSYAEIADLQELAAAQTRDWPLFLFAGFEPTLVAGQPDQIGLRSQHSPGRSTIELDRVRFRRPGADSAEQYLDLGGCQFTRLLGWPRRDVAQQIYFVSRCVESEAALSIASFEDLASRLALCAEWRPMQRLEWAAAATAARSGFGPEMQTPEDCWWRLTGPATDSARPGQLQLTWLLLRRSGCVRPLGEVTTLGDGTVLHANMAAGLPRTTMHRRSSRRSWRAEVDDLRCISIGGATSPIGASASL